MLRRELIAIANGLPNRRFLLHSELPRGRRYGGEFENLRWIAFNAGEWRFGLGRWVSRSVAEQARWDECLQWCDGVTTAKRQQ